AEHVRCPEPLLHEPDLCVAYGAALRAATHGTRYLFPPRGPERKALELHVTSPAGTRDVLYELTGVVRSRPAEAHGRGSESVDPAFVLDGFSVRVRPAATGLVDEVFLDDRASFAHPIELQPDTDNAVELTLCDGAGAEVARVLTTLRHNAEARP